MVGDRTNSVFAYLRNSLDGGPAALVVCNFTPAPQYEYRLGVPHEGAWTEALNSDASGYGGSNVRNGGAIQADAIPSHGFPFSLSLTLPPLATLILQA